MKKTILFSFLFANIFLAILSYFASDDYYFYTGRALKNTNITYVLIYSLAVILFVAGAFTIRNNGKLLTFSRDQHPNLELIVLCLGLLLIAAHINLIYFARDLFTSSDLIKAKKMLDLTGRKSLIPFIHLHTAFAAYVGIVLVAGKGRLSRTGKKIVFIELVLFLLICIRGCGLERLALFEHLVCLGLYVVLLNPMKQLKKLAVFGVVIVVLFGAIESQRSWQVYRNKPMSGGITDNLFVFTVGRFAYYYMSAFNNASSIENLKFEGETNGFYTLRLFSETPLVGKVVQKLGLNFVNEKYIATDILNQLNGLNPEFNLFGAVGFQMLDWKRMGIFLSLILGILYGWIYRSSTQANLGALIIFTIFMIGMLEYPRLHYFTLERNFFSYALAFCFIFNQQKLEVYREYSKW